MVKIVSIILTVLLAASIITNMVVILRRSTPRDIGIGRLIEGIRDNTDRVADALSEVRKECSDVPGRVLASIQGSTNARSGKLHELVCIMKITSMYRSLIPLGSPIDYIGIGDEYIDFVEVKSGNATLTQGEKHIRDLIELGKVRFLLMKSEVDLTSMVQFAEDDNG